MLINNVGYNFCHDNNFRINRPYGSGDYLLLVIRCRCLFELGGKEITVPENTILLFRMGTPQVYRPVDGEFVNDWIHFDLEDREVQALTDMGIPFDMPVYLEDTVVFTGLIREMYQEKYSVNEHKQNSMELYARLLFNKLSERINSGKATELRSKSWHQDYLTQLRTRIYSIPANHWTIGDMAEELSLSQSYFQHLYKQTFGVSVMSDVLQSRMEFAKYLLISTDYPVKSIAEACGYRNDVHFMRQFKDNQHMTPSAYRSRYRISQEELTRGKGSPPYTIQTL